ncbi:MAG: aldehyde dehydrogenase family protein [Phycisphaera sp.]|nr:aldehyde dehydrogenase family protein [Phycisphaera sp.]
MLLSEAYLAQAPSDYIDGAFRPLSGDGIVTRDPARPSGVVWAGSPVAAHAEDAVAAARRAFPAWAALPLDTRRAHLERWRETCVKHAGRLAAAISREIGKVKWEAELEAKIVAEKVTITLEERVLARIAGFEVAAGAGKTGVCTFRPHGVMTVLGPYNFPAHLPNGHIVPALLAGNTIVFKPSEKGASVGQLLAELAHEAGFPAGVFNVVQGGGAIASRLATHPEVDGVLFTGSFPVGRRILEANLDTPGRLVALEMGGSNPAVVTAKADLRRAAIECVRAAFATTGQRCTCTRRIVVADSVADRFVPMVLRLASTLVVAAADDGVPAFMGPLVTAEARDAVLRAQAALAARGRLLLEASALEREGFFLSPGAVEVERFERRADEEEIFGPFVQISRARDLDDAIAQANATNFGLAASVFTDDRSEWEAFFAGVRAGCLNWNAGTAGASSKLPFGGLGRSGNHRPAGAFAVDSVAYPVATMIDLAEPVVPQGMLVDARALGASA